MSHERALLDAIRAAPDDDTPRLAYADWLGENGDADRAEFIRLQCAAARMPLNDKERRKKEKAVAALFKAHKADWFGSVWKKFHTAKTAVGHCRIDRGFIVSLKGDVRQFVTTAADIDRLAPCLRRVEVRHVEGDLGQIMKLPFLRRVAELELETMEPESLPVLLKAPDWGPLDSLDLEFQFDDPETTLAGLGNAPLVKAARRFGINYGYFIEDGTGDTDDEAAQEPSLREMRRLRMPNLLSFGFHGMSLESAKEVAAWPGFKRLDTLDLGLCNLEDPVPAALLNAPTLPHLTRLYLNENNIGRRTIEAVATSPKLSKLTYLTLHWVDLRDADATRLAKSKTLPAVLPMNVSYNHFTKRGIEKLRERFGPGVVSEDQFG